VTQTLEILYVGSEHRSELDDISARGAVILGAKNVYDGIARLLRSRVGVCLVELEALEPRLEAVQGLRDAAGERPVLVSMTIDDWELLRNEGLIDQDEVLLRPYYPDELWRRVTRRALPPPAKAVENFKGDADQLAALINDAKRLNRFVNDLRAFAHHTVNTIRTRLRAGRVTLFLRGKKPGELRVIDGTGLAQTVLDGATLEIGKGVAGEAARKRRVTLVREAGRDGPATERDYKGASYMIAPLIHEQLVFGVLCVTDRLEPGPFDDSDRAYLEAFAEMASQTAWNGLQYHAADELATIDEGTQLFNRRHFNRVLPQEVMRARRYRHDLTLALLDVDHFKRYNDSNGHQAGDRALALVAKILNESFRQSDIVVRYGGEEFAVIMPETTREEGNGVGFVDRARERVEEAGLTFEDIHGNTRVLTISGGVATLPLQAETWEELFEKADQALYKAKELGRNRIVGY
jgi:diguanylate cyclase (GGDEF)-like protein